MTTVNCRPNSEVGISLVDHAGKSIKVVMLLCRFLTSNGGNCFFECQRQRSWQHTQRVIGSGVANSIIGGGGGNIHIFVFTNLKNK
jgi:hypothetical protein